MREEDKIFWALGVGVIVVPFLAGWMYSVTERIMARLAKNRMTRVREYERSIRGKGK